MNKLLVFLAGCALVFSFNASAQTPTISHDSLQSLFKIANDSYYDYDYKTAFETNALILEEATKSDNQFFIFRAHNELGLLHSEVADTAMAREHLKIALSVAKEAKVDSLISWAYNDLANSYTDNLETYPIAINYYKEAIKANSNSPDYENLVEYMNIGWTHLDLNEPHQALPYLEKTLALTKLEKQHPLLDLNLKILFGRHAFDTDENPDESIRIFTETAKTAVDSNYLEQASTSYGYLAKANTKRGNYLAVSKLLEKQKVVDEKLAKIKRDFVATETSAKFAVERYKSELEIAKNKQALSDQKASQSKWKTIFFVISTIIFLFISVALFLLYKSRRHYIKGLYEKNIELEAAKLETERLSNLKTKFFSTVSHELRTPLYGVIGISSILLEDKKLKSHREDLKSLKFSADYLLALINDVLMINKMDTNNVKLEQTPFKLNKLINEICRSFAFSLEQNNNKIHINVDGRIPNQLIGDSVRLSQIMMNLVGNAVKFNENGNIWINIEYLRQTPTNCYRAKFMISDDGIGISKADQKTIFEEFSQVKDHNYNYKGTGLGLPIVKKLLALYGSTIKVESNVNEGATFSFELDLCPYEIPVEGMEISKATDNFVQENAELENVNVLVVDDNRINLKITQRILEKRNFNCTLAHDGKGAIDLAKEQRFDLILMDIHMPGIGGIEATQTIRAFDPNTPIIALTAVEIDEIRKQVFEAGMNDIILKPYDVTEFMNIILKNLVKAYTRI